MSTKSSPSKISWPSSTSSSSRRSSGGLNGFSRQSPDSVSCLVSNDHVHLPRELPCRHQVCMVFVKAKADQNQLFTCPSCSEIFRLGKNGNVDELANNFRYDEKAGLLELASDLAALSPNQGSSGHPSDGIWSNTNGADVAKQSNKNEKNTSHVKQHLSGYSYQFQSDFSANQVLGPMFNAPNTSLANGWQAMHEIGATNHLGLNGASFLANLNLGLASSVMISPTKLVKKSEFCSCQSVNEGASSGNPVMPSGNPVTSFCRQCDEDLCEVCVGAHKRVTLTRNHDIFKYPDKSPSDTEATPCRGQTPEIAASPPLQDLFGTPPPSAELLKVYADAVERAKADCDKLLVKARQGCAHIEEAKMHVGSMEVRIDKRYQSVKSEIEFVLKNLQNSVKNREKVLLERLDYLRKMKMSVLVEQKKDLDDTVTRLKQVSDQLTSTLASGKEFDLINACKSANNAVSEAQKICGTLAVHEDDTIVFDPPNPLVLKTILNLGFIGGSSFAKNSFAEGDGIVRAILGKDAKFLVFVCDQLNEKRTSGGDSVKVQIQDPDRRPIPHAIQDLQNGSHRVVWKPVVEGEYTIQISIKEQCIRNSPFKVFVRAGRNFDLIEKPVFTFGSEGANDGELCRPWGICCSKEGFILVANRSNNRIEVFTDDGKFHHKFGTSGKMNGQFERPSGVCCDSNNRVIVVDKDNHRIQIFTIEGHFLSMFGEKGSRLGQFNYPWDVACNSKDQILVSDTRNHRIQLFTPTGGFLLKYGFDGTLWKHFDSPRGVCFRSDGLVVVTDFNNHRLLVVDLLSQKAQSLGQEGSGDGMFIRPNGVAVDDEGHLIVADSRNDRIQVFTSTGVFLKKIGMKGLEPGEFDRPSGITISSKGLIYVVDFGNNRVQVF